MVYQYWFLVDNEMHIRVIQECYLIFDWLLHEHDHVLNEYNQHVEHVEIEHHFDP